MTHYFLTKETFIEAFEENMHKMFNKEIQKASPYEHYQVISSMLKEEMDALYQETNAYVSKHQLKKVIYFSMEFLIGRLLRSNLANMGVYDIVKEGLDHYGIDLNTIEDQEADAGLGNGGLGRLAACFLDSAASLSLPFYGNSLRYEKGFFTQKIENNKQVEYPDAWLEKPFVWEEKREDLRISIPFFGYVEYTKLLNPVLIDAVAYDVKVIGANQVAATHLRLWKTEPSALHQHQDPGYLEMVSAITRSLYPDDSTEKGKTLRLQQQYVFSAAGIKAVILEHKAHNRDIKALADYYVFQINDTHPTLIIPELMRILMDEENLGYDEAWRIVTKTVAFTNHTILSEALEKWNIPIFRNLLPRIFEIVQEMDRRFKEVLRHDGRFNDQQVYLMGLIGQNHVRMAHICLYASFSVNGVAKLHTHILKTIEMKDFYALYPKKFNNKTNGVTHRRWLININKELSDILDRYVGDGWKEDLSKIEALKKHQDQKALQDDIDLMKLKKKEALSAYILEKEGIQVDPKSIFDIQVKRLHEYKRQLLNILHIIYVYQRLKYDKAFKANYHPHTFIFGAKAAPSYHMARAIIELINQVASVINQDSETEALLKVVFIQNYNVTYAEKLMPAADISEQISTASKEASGTGNMKFMMNGALTLGTMDGANVEIVEHAGIDNEVIFGLTSQEVTHFYSNQDYHPRDIMMKDARLQSAFFFIRNLNLNPQHYDYILNNLLNTDYYFVLKDFASYVEAHEEMNRRYQDRELWLKQSILNIAFSGYFSSDRTINDYNKDIWHVDKIKIK